MKKKIDRINQFINRLETETDNAIVLSPSENNFGAGIFATNRNCTNTAVGKTGCNGTNDYCTNYGKCTETTNNHDCNNLPIPSMNSKPTCQTIGPGGQS